MNPESHWILLRGLARESRHWGTFLNALQEAIAREDGVSEEAVVVDPLDIPGSGRYSEMRCPPSITKITEFVREKFLELRQRQREQGKVPAKRTYLVAVSLGGMIASRWMERWPEDFAGVVLENSSFHGYSPVYRRLTPAALRHFVGIARNRSDAVARERAVLEMVSNRPELYEKLSQEWAQIHLDRPVSLENFARQLLAAARFSPQLKFPPAPVLILNSLGDRMVHPSCSVEIASRWNAELRRHPTAGHDLAVDAESWVIDEIAGWYRRQILRQKLKRR